MWKEKLGNYLIDVSKYIFTGVVITSMFKDFGNKISLYVVGLALSIVTLALGLVLTNKVSEKNKEQK